MNNPPPFNFNADYKTARLKIKEDYNFILSKQDNKVFKFAKKELDRLYKRILKSNSNLKGKRVSDTDITELYHDIIFSDILRLSSTTGSSRQQIDNVHMTESHRLIEAIRGAKRFSEA